MMNPIIIIKREILQATCNRRAWFSGSPNLYIALSTRFGRSYTLPCSNQDYSLILALILFSLKVFYLSISSRAKRMYFMVSMSSGMTLNSRAFTRLLVLSISSRSLFIVVSSSAAVMIFSTRSS